MAPTTRLSSKRKATNVDAIPAPAAKKARTTATPAASTKKVTARSVTLAAKKTAEIADNKTAAGAKKASAKTTAAAIKKTATRIAVPATKKTLPKTNAAKKLATKASAPAAKTSLKRKQDDTSQIDENAGEGASRPTKKAKAKAEAKSKVAKPKVIKSKAVKPKVFIVNSARLKVIINHAPTQRLDVYVFGEGSSGELGLGTARNAIDVKRPRLNPYLLAATVGVVQLSAGGMHVAALTHDNRILTWGVNDHGALGRDTQWGGGLRDMADNESDDMSDSGLNPIESTPTAIPSDSFPRGAVFTKVATGDSLTIALTDDGHVYGWGTFRSGDGILGFSKESHVQLTPVLLPGLEKITDIVCGANHALALHETGQVFIWGSGEQNQLGYRIVLRTRLAALTPYPLRFRRKMKKIGCGQDHSFAIGQDNQVWTWGLNSFGETGVPGNAGDDNAFIGKPELVETLFRPNDQITHIAGGAHHSVAVTEAGRCLVWGRLDGNQCGLDPDLVQAFKDGEVICDSKGSPRILLVPTELPEIVGATYAACGTDHSICIDGNGDPYSWGFSANYQTGHGVEEDITVPTQINNTAVRGKIMSWAGAGGQYSMLAGPQYVEPASKTGEHGEMSAIQKGKQPARQPKEAPEKEVDEQIEKEAEKQLQMEASAEPEIGVSKESANEAEKQVQMETSAEPEIGASKESANEAEEKL